VPEVGALLHGFLAQRWVTASPIDPAQPDAPERLGHYLGRRHALLPPPVTSGAGLQALAEMAAFNIAAELGEPAGARFAERFPLDPALQDQVRPIAIDGRLDVHEWLAVPTGAG
jgi:hypothetical protein